jgi:pantoate--beta-alanine ligase
MQRLAGRWRQQNIRVGFVPTMGYLHAGHLSLVKTARRLAGKKGVVVVSIYVNPTQFGPAEDFSRYPRDLQRDLKLCRGEGVDIVFCPADQDMYPNNPKAPFSTFVIEEALSQGMEGTSRPTHFRGVTTVVAKLFNIVQPQFAVFGQKDYQQAAIVKRMVKDLNFPIQIVIAPIYREVDGLAMSSRNRYLEGELRAQATILWRSLQKIRKSVSRPAAAARLKAEIRSLVKSQPAAELDYVEFFDPETLKPVAQVKRGVHVALAVKVGKTRLIDNARL